MIAYSNSRYLASKKTVDDRALNKNVFDRLRAELSSSNAPLRVVEVGGGLGTMVARLVEWGLLGRAEYRLFDVDSDLLAGAEEWLAGWAALHRYSAERSQGAIHLRADHFDVAVRFIRAELGEYLDGDAMAPDADLLIANAFLDLVDVPAVLPRLLRWVSPSGVFWFSINYDGETIFEPGEPDDAAILGAYDLTMNQRLSHGRPAGDSETGRHLFGHLARAGASVLVAGASDWVVHPRAGRYDADEEYFLHHIIHTIDEALKGGPAIDSEVLARWIGRRHDQASRGELVYMAHQLDFVGCRSAPDRP
jgi:SAM-dependent methyltransferase